MKFAAEEKMLRTHTPNEVPLFFPCVVHKVSTSQTWQLGIVNDDISAVIACALAMSGSGSVDMFRRCLLQVMKERLDLIHTEPPGGHIEANRKAVYDLFLSSSLSRLEGSATVKARRQRQRLVLDTFLAGDLEASRVGFYTRGKPLTYADAEVILAEQIVPALVPTTLPIFPRHRWLGGEATLDWLGLVQAHHGLLGPTLERMLGPMKTNTPVVDAGQVASSWDGTVEAAVQWAQESAKEDGDGQAGEVSAPVPLPLPAAPEENKDAAASQNWAELKKSFQQKVRQWVAKRDLNVLAVVRNAMTVVTSLFYGFLKKAAPEWERQQQHRCLQGQCRKYRATECAIGSDLVRAFDRISILLHSPIRALPTTSWKMGFKVLMLRLLARIAGALHFFLRSSFQKCPYLVFGLLDEGRREKIVQELQGMPPCVRDAFTSHFMDAFPGTAIVSQEALGVG